MKKGVEWTDIICLRNTCLTSSQTQQLHQASSSGFRDTTACMPSWLPGKRLPTTRAWAKVQILASDWPGWHTSLRLEKFHVLPERWILLDCGRDASKCMAFSGLKRDYLPPACGQKGSNRFEGPAGSICQGFIVGFGYRKCSHFHEKCYSPTHNTSRRSISSYSETC